MRTTPFVRRLTRALTPAVAILTLSACATTTGSNAPAPEPGADTFCRIAHTITWADSDTDETIRQVKSHNAVWVRLCGGGE